jgi:ABC-type branched-subunit amino acid transport system substrate-binding protein
MIFGASLIRMKGFRVGLGTAAVAALACTLLTASCSTPAETTPPSKDAGTTDTAAPEPVSAACADAAAPIARPKTNKQCAEAAGEPAVYVAAANDCVKLKSVDCTVIEGSTDDENTVIFGALLAQSGSNAASGLARTNSARLAVRELNEATRSTGGVPSPNTCAAGRPIALVACDDNEDPANNHERKRAARHLVDELRVAAILGGSTSGSTVDIATNVTLPKKTLLFAPSSTAISITALAGATVDGSRLVWRAAPSDVVQSKVLALQVGELEAIAKLANGGAAVKLAVVWKADAYGTGINDTLKTLGVINGKPFADPGNAGSYLEQTYDPTKAGQLDAATAAINVFKPNIVLLIGTAEAITGIMVPHETAGNKPLYLLPDGPRKPELITAVTGNEDLRKRIRGTIPGFVTPLADNFFYDRYKVAFPENNPTLSYGMAGAYDAIYLFTYALATSSGQPTGTDMAKGLARMAGASPRIDVGPASISQGIQAMVDGRTVNFNGASGPLDFDVATGEAPSDYSIFCVRFDDMGVPYYFDSTGETYSAEQKKLVGTFKCQ